MRFAIPGRALRALLVVALLVTGLVVGAGAPAAHAGTFPGRDGLIVFQSNRDPFHDEIYTMTAEGTGITQLTDNDQGNTEPAWSADGTKIVFVSRRDGNAEIYSMDANGGNQTRLTNTPSLIESEPTFSPDGTKIAFISTTGGPGDLWVMDANGANAVDISNDSLYESSPSWSPDGAKILLSRDFEIVTVDPDGTDPVNLTNTPGASEGEPEWSPTGDRIVYSGNEGIRPGFVIMAANGSGKQYLGGTNVGIDTGPTWSPDGYFLAFSSTRSNNRSIYVMRADNSGEVQRLTNGIPPGSGFPTEVAPNWQPLPGPGDPTGEFTSLTPSRIVDTRNGTGGRLGKLGPAQSFDVQINGQGGVPATGVSAVVLNATVTEPTTPSYLTVWPAGVTRPTPSNLNYVPGQTVANLVTVAVGAGGKVSVYNNAGATHVIFDVVGFYADSTGPAGSRFHALTPFRLFDTRTDEGPLAANQTKKVPVLGARTVPKAGVTSLVLNVTLTQPNSSGFITVYPDDVSRPVASNLNFVPGLTAPNLVVVRVPASGIIDFYHYANFGGTTFLLADVVGYFDNAKPTEAGRLVSGMPVRLIDTRLSSPAPPPGCIGPSSTLTLSFTSPQIGAVVLNTTVTAPTASGHLIVYPQPPPPPLSSNLNFVPGQTVPNLVMVKLGTDNKIGFFNSAGCTHLVVDLFGAFTSASAPAPSLAGASSPDSYGDVTASIE